MAEPTPPTPTPPAGDPPPAPPTIDPAEHAKLAAHKLTLDSDLAKERAEKKALKDALAKRDALLKEAGISTEKTPQERELERLQAAGSERDFEVTLLRGMAAQGLAYVQADEDFGEVVVKKAKKLKDAGADMTAVLLGLKESGWIKALGVTTTGGPPPPSPPTPTVPTPPAKPASTAAPATGEFDNVKTFADLGRLGPSKMAAFAEKHPDRYRSMKDQHNGNLSRPRMPAFPVPAAVK